MVGSGHDAERGGPAEGERGPGGGRARALRQVLHGPQQVDLHHRTPLLHCSVQGGRLQHHASHFSEELL